MNTEELILYHKQNYKRVPLDLRIEDYRIVSEIAKKKGEPLNCYIKKAIEERIIREGDVATPFLTVRKQRERVDAETQKETNIVFIPPKKEQSAEKDYKKRLLNIEELMEYTGIGRNNARLYAERIGALRKVGKRYLYDRKIIDEALDNATMKLI